MLIEVPRNDHTSNVDLVQVEASAVVLDRKQNFEVLSLADLAKLWVKVHGGGHRHAILIDVTTCHQVGQLLLIGHHLDESRGLRTEV